MRYNEWRLWVWHHLWHVRGDCGIRQHVSMIFQNRSLCVGECVEVCSNLSDDFRCEFFGVASVDSITARRASHSPICALKNANSELRDKPALSECEGLVFR